MFKAFFSEKFLMLLLVAAAASVIFVNAIRPATYDEIDYLAAADLSVTETWLSSNTVSFMDFLDEGLRKVGKQDRPSLSLVSENRDGFLLRHFHGVLPTYFLKILIYLCSDLDSARIFFTSLVFFVFAVSFILFLNKVSCRGTGNGLRTLVLAALLFSPGTIESFSLTNFHTILAVLMIGYLYFLDELVKLPTIKSSVGLGFFSALMVLTLETSLFIILSGFAFFVFSKPKDYAGRNPWFLVVLASISTILILQPGWFKSLDTLKAVLMYAYRLFVKGGAEYASGGKLDLLISSIISFWPFLAVFLILVFCNFIQKYGNFGEYKVVFSDGYRSGASVGACYLILIIPFTLNVTYLFPGILALSLAASNVSSVKSTFGLRVLVSTFTIPYCIFLLVVNLSLISDKRESLQVSQRELVSEINSLSWICAGSTVNSSRLLSSDANIFNLFLGLDCARLLILDHDGVSLVVRDARTSVPLQEFLQSDSTFYFSDLRRSPRNELRNRLVPFIKEEVAAGSHTRLLRLGN